MMREAFDVMGRHPLLTVFLGVLSILALESLSQAIVIIFSKEK